MVLILQQLVNVTLVSVADLFNVTTADPVLFVHPPEGSVTLLNNTLKEPIFPPEIEKLAEPGALPSRHAKLTLNR